MLVRTHLLLDPGRMRHLSHRILLRLRQAAVHRQLPSPFLLRLANRQMRLSERVQHGLEEQPLHFDLPLRPILLARAVPVQQPQPCDVAEHLLRQTQLPTQQLLPRLELLLPVQPGLPARQRLMRQLQLRPQLLRLQRALRLQGGLLHDRQAVPPVQQQRALQRVRVRLQKRIQQEQSGTMCGQERTCLWKE